MEEEFELEEDMVLMDEDFDDFQSVLRDAQENVTSMGQERDDFSAVLQHVQEDLAAIGPEVAAEPEHSLMDSAKDYFIDKMVPEIWDAFTHEVSLGASELAKGLMGHEDPFVLYGGGLEPTQTYDIGDTQQQSFEGMVQDASAVYGRGQEQEMER